METANHVFVLHDPKVDGLDLVCDHRISRSLHIQNALVERAYKLVQLAELLFEDCYLSEVCGFLSVFVLF